MQKEAQEEQFKLCPEAYLRKHHVLTYLEDALTQLALQEQPPRSVADSARFVSDYFSSVMNGTHILFRDFSFINSTPFNRICFLKSVHRTYKALLQYSQSLSIQVSYNYANCVYGRSLSRLNFRVFCRFVQKMNTKRMMNLNLK